jgi:thymidylate kinase
MRFLILEGIATSGKSTVIEAVSRDLGDSLKVLLLSEEQTHVPIMKDTKDSHIGFFENLIDKAIAAEVDLVIIDRFYLTQAFRAELSLAEYKSVESKLRPYSPLTVFLEVDEDAIEKRVAKAAEHRPADWGEYIRTKGKTPQEIAAYYANQQESQLALLKESSLPFMVFGTTNHDYESVEQTILKEITKK